jgi:ABC-2 type transport system permease protein
MWVIFKVMALGLLRDRAGLVLAFILPPVVFIVFASVFGASASGQLDIHAGAVVQVESTESTQLLSTLHDVLKGRLTMYQDEASLTHALDLGEVDAGLLVTGKLSSATAPLVVLISPGKRAAGSVLTAEVAASVAKALPQVTVERDVARLAPLLSLTPEQVARIDFAKARKDPDLLVSQRVIEGSDPIVVYYAGAVSILFLMFSSMQNAMGLIDERRMGLRLRLALSVGGVLPLLSGRMIWLLLLGVIQAFVLFTVAAVVYKVPLLHNLLPWLVTAVCAAAASGGVALALATACETREQAQTVSTFVILILAAVGGSMAPRFLMPAALQTIGWLTPHAWVIEAYQSVLWRQSVDAQVFMAWAMLGIFCVLGFVIAFAIESRRKL